MERSRFLPFAGWSYGEGEGAYAAGGGAEMGNVFSFMIQLSLQATIFPERPGKKAA